MPNIAVLLLKTIIKIVKLNKIKVRNNDKYIYNILNINLIFLGKKEFNKSKCKRSG